MLSTQTSTDFWTCNSFRRWKRRFVLRTRREFRRITCWGARMPWMRCLRRDTSSCRRRREAGGSCPRQWQSWKVLSVKSLRKYSWKINCPKNAEGIQPDGKRTVFSYSLTFPSLCGIMVEPRHDGGVREMVGCIITAYSALR